MTKKKWIILGVVVGVLAVVTATLLTFREHIFEGGGSNKEVTISITRVSLDPTADFSKFGKITSSSVSSTAKVGTNPWIRVEPSSVGCIYSIRVNGEEVYDYINDPNIRSITDPFTYTFTNIQKNSTIVVTLDKRGDISELRNRLLKTQLVSLEEDASLGGGATKVVLHPLFTTGWADVKNTILDKASPLFNSGVFTIKNNEFVFGDISLFNDGNIFASHGTVKIKVKANSGFALLGLNWAGENDATFDEVSGSVNTGVIHRVDDSSVTSLNFSPSGDKYNNTSNPLATFITGENCIVINNFDDFIRADDNLVLYYIPEEVEVITYKKIDIEAGKIEGESQTKRFLEVLDTPKSVSYSETDNIGGANKTTNLTYLNVDSASLTVSVVDKNSMNNIWLTTNITVTGSGKKVIKLIV